MNFIENIFLKMTWLYSWSEYLVTDIFGLSMNSKLGGGLQFFIYDTIKIFLLLGFLIFSISYIQSYFPPERTKKILGRFKGVTGNTLGALLGTITPFCSCSSIPLFIGFTSAGLPLGITFSFLISSPLVDLASFLLLSSFFGFKIAAIYVIVGIILAVVGGVIIDKMNMIKHVEEYILNIENVDTEIQTMSMKERIHFSKGQVKEIFDKVWFPILIGVGIGALIHNVIPRETIEMLLGKDNPFAVIIATVIGIPMYADIFGTLPIAEALYMKGVGLGTILALMMSVTALSFPSIVMLSKVVKPKLLGLYIGLVSIGIVIIGYLFNAITL
ncbi:permease [Cetobacterium sp. 2A]|uniref:permease n=1 Tax=unclassified Cetobacterium TaxID=2630983 RepID=UPI00163C3DE8|nr:permease [Cetobacterium sp. 2A]MBC2857195.1 permease [Cetobacterium sp. 2A]